MIRDPTQVTSQRNHLHQKQGHTANGNVNCTTYNLHLGSIYSIVRFNSHMAASYPGSPSLVTGHVRLAVEEKQIGANLQALLIPLSNYHFNNVQLVLIGLSHLQSRRRHLTQPLACQLVQHTYQVGQRNRSTPNLQWSNTWLLSSCLYRASMTIKTLYYPTDTQIYNA